MTARRFEGYVLMELNSNGYSQYSTVYEVLPSEPQR